MLRNLIAEMARADLSYKDLAKAINKDERSISNKISCRTEFTRKEMVEIKRNFFPNCYWIIFSKRVKWEGSMLQKKIITLDRKTGKTLSERIEGKANMTNEEYFAPMVELYKESINRLDMMQMEKHNNEAVKC